MLRRGSELPTSEPRAQKLLLGGRIRYFAFRTMVRAVLSPKGKTH